LGASTTELNLLHGCTATTADLNSIAAANIASTGNMITMQHIPWSSSVAQVSGTYGTAASSTDIRLTIMSSGIAGVSSWHIPASRFGFTKVLAVQAQIQSTRTVWSMADRHPMLVVTSILPTYSTVRIQQYTSSVPTMLGSSVGMLTESTGACHLQVFAYGYS
jgi:hypothetical protein